MSNSVKVSPPKISSLLSADRINLNVKTTQKNAALREVAKLLEHHKSVTNFETFVNEVLARERASTTALEHDVAIPHARTDHCSDIVMAVGRNSEGIEFEAKDGNPVRLLFLIGTPKQMVTEYLRVVSSLARLLKNDDVRQRLLDAPDPASFIKVIDEAET